MIRWLIASQFFVLAFAKHITIIQDTTDQIITPIVQALNISLVFYKDVNKIKEKLDMNVLQIDGNTTTLDDRFMQTDFIISLARDAESKQRILQTAQNLNVPTIQAQLFPWDGFYKNDDQVTITDNYAVMVPSYIVFDNMLYDFVRELNVTGDVVVIFDQKYQDTLEYDWRKPFQNLTVPVKFHSAEKAPELITAHLNRLEQSTKNLLFITDTVTVERYVLAAQKQIESNLWTWLVFTKDTLPFKCFQCNDVQIYWARVVKSTASEELSNFADFIWSEELETQFLFSRNTYNHLQTSYCLDIIYTAMDYLIGMNLTQQAKSELDKELDPRGSNVTVRELLERNKDYDFGYFKNHYGHHFYQVTKAIIVHINRMSRFHDDKVSKHIANWTLIDGIVPLYSDLGVNVRQLTHYRVVTILQEPFIQLGGPESTHGFQGYCIDLLEMIRQDLNFTYDLYLVPDDKF